MGGGDEEKERVLRVRERNWISKKFGLEHLNGHIQGICHLYHVCGIHHMSYSY